jgi:hypothetical protein
LNINELLSKTSIIKKKIEKRRRKQRQGIEKNDTSEKNIFSDRCHKENAIKMKNREQRPWILKIKLNNMKLKI